MGDLNLAVGKSNLVTGLKGWAVDLSDALPGKKNGTEPVTINFRVNGKFGVLPQIVANIKRVRVNWFVFYLIAYISVQCVCGGGRSF